MDLFDLYVRISIDSSEYEKDLDEAGGKTHSFSEKMKTGLATAAKVGATAIGAAATAVAAFAKNSIEQYAEYEQLVGGVETLFKQSSDAVMNYANNAYKTAGLSANEYMSTVTSFSASLLQSLDGDTARAAEKADQAIVDMSDNANKMGTSMESIQNAYQGFAKQNFTMLDNLKLGYGGTKEEMQRLLDDAEKLSGVKYDISSYADIVDAIHVVQGEMGISGRTAEEVAEIYKNTGREVSEQLGTTAREASTTIQGSVSAMKSAWSNLVTGIADDNANMDTLIGNFVDSAATAADNIIPRVETVLSGIGDLIERMSPIIADRLPAMVEAVLPSLLSAGAGLLEGLVTGITTSLPTLVASALPIIMTLSNSLTQQLPMIIEAGIQVIATLVTGLAQAAPTLVPQMVDTVILIAETILQNVDQLIIAGGQLVVGLFQGIVTVFSEFVGEIGGWVDEYILSPIREKDGNFLEIGQEILTNIWNSMVAVWENVSAWFGNIWDGIFSGGAKAIEDSNTVAEAAHAAAEATGASTGLISQGFKDVSTSVAGTQGEFAQTMELYNANVGDAVNSMVDIVSTGVEDLDKSAEAHEAGAGTIQALIDGIQSKLPSLMSELKSIGQQMTSALQSGIGTVTIPVNVEASGNIPAMLQALISSPMTTTLRICIRARPC